MAKEINNDTIAKFENDLNNHPVFNVASHAAQVNDGIDVTRDPVFADYYNEWIKTYK